MSILLVKNSYFKTYWLAYKTLAHDVCIEIDTKYKPLLAFSSSLSKKTKWIHFYSEIVTFLVFLKKLQVDYALLFIEMFIDVKDAEISSRIISLFQSVLTT